MKKRIVKMIAAAVAGLSVFALTSCTGTAVNKTLKVNSSIYPEINELSSAQVNEKELDRWCYVDNPYVSYTM